MGDDLIKRSDAIRALIEWYGCKPNDIEAFEKIIEAIPSADRPQGWIPCSERLPKEFVDVLVCLTDGSMDVVKLTDYIDIDGEPKWCHGTAHTLGGAVLSSDVLAWMPLPEPWEGADDDSGSID